MPKQTTDEDRLTRDRNRITVDVKLIRMRLELSREEFSEFYKIPLHLIESWESGTAKPDGANQTYLRLIVKAPELIKSTLKQVA